MISTIAGHKVVVTMAPIVANDDTEGAGVGVDRQGYGDVLLIAQQGISADTLSGSVYWSIKFQACDDNATWALMDVADIEGAATATHVIDAAAEDPTTIVRLYRGGLRYVRIFWDATGTHTNGTPIAGVVVLGRPNYIPTTQPAELGTDV